MADLTKCSSCDSCQNCNICQSCDACETYCESNQSSDNNFKYNKCFSTGQYICNDTTGFSREDWNAGIARINKVFNTGIAPATGANISKNTSDTFLSADEFKRVAKAAEYSNINEITKNGLIYGKYFSKLESAIATLNYKKTQCRKCNAGCQICDACNSGCDAGKQKQEESYCCKCNTGETSTE